jgi:hypothetical protein
MKSGQPETTRTRQQGQDSQVMTGWPEYERLNKKARAGLEWDKHDGLDNHDIEDSQEIETGKGCPNRTVRTGQPGLDFPVPLSIAPSVSSRPTRSDNHIFHFKAYEHH